MKRKKIPKVNPGQDLKDIIIYLWQFQILKTYLQETLSRNSDVSEKLQEESKISVKKRYEKYYLRKSCRKMLEHTQCTHFSIKKNVEGHTKTKNT